MIDWSEQDMRVSRTELKKSHERLQALSIPLANLSKKQLKKLPASDYFMAEFWRTLLVLMHVIVRPNVWVN